MLHKIHFLIVIVTTKCISYKMYVALADIFSLKNRQIEGFKEEERERCGDRNFIESYIKLPYFLFVCFLFDLSYIHRILKHDI